MTQLKTHHFFAALAVTLPMGLLTGLAIAADKTPAAPKAALTVTLVKPESRTITSAVSANGTVAAWQEASVSAEVSGLRLTEINAQVGDVVKKGQVLARSSQDTLNAEIAATKAQMAEAQASFEEAKANADRARELAKQGFYSNQAISQAVAQEKAAIARLDAAKANLALQNIRLSHSDVRAPDSGVITARSSAAALGSVVAAGVELFRMTRQGRLEWRGEVTSNELPNITRGSVVTFIIDGRRLSGKVRQIAPNLDAQTRNGIVYVDLANAGLNGAVKVGQFVRGEFAGASKTALMLPASSVVQRDGFAYVFANKDGKVSQLKVTLGQRAGNAVEVTSGLDASAAVVATGAAFLTDGDTVKVVQP
jgi:HlyD family secretion protein